MIKQVIDKSVIYYDDEYHKIGSGYVTSIEKIALEKCPACRKINLESNVIHGLCAWCGFDANEKN